MDTRILRLAWRNVWRARRRSLVTIVAMSFALVVLILYSGLMEGFLGQMEANILELEMGDVQVYADGYRKDPSLYERIDDPEPLLSALIAQGYPASGRLLGWGLAAVDEASAGAALRGIEIAREQRVSRIHEHVADGQWLAADDPKGVVIGRRLADTLEATPGAELMVLSQGADGAMAADLYRVRGILGSVSELTDRAAIFMNADAFRELMVVDDGVHQIVVRRPEGSELEPAAAVVTAAAIGYDVQTWRQLVPTLASMMDSGRSAVLVMFAIVYLVVAVLILNAMLMAVFERVRELGVMKALGVGPLELLGLIYLESGIQVAIAIGAGLVVAIPGLAYLIAHGIDLGMVAGTSMMGMTMDTVWYAVVRASVFTRPIAMLVGITALAVLYPALRAAAVEPIEAMRHR